MEFISLKMVVQASRTNTGEMTFLSVANSGDMKTSTPLFLNVADRLKEHVGTDFFEHSSNCMAPGDALEDTTSMEDFSFS